MTELNQLLHACGLSVKGAARLLNVRVDSVYNWKYGRCNAPDGVIKDLTKYAKAAERIFKNDKE